MADEIKPEWMDQRDKYKTKDKVAIVGFAESWKKTPFNDSSYEIWGLNSLFELFGDVKGRQDIWFEIHDINIFDLRTNQQIGYGLTREGKPYLDALKNLKRPDGSPCPIFMVEVYEDIPNSVRYPFELVKEKYGNYFTNSISYMIALAILWEYKEIAIYGVDMATSTEYGSQRPSCEYYVGIATGKGIKVYIPPEADLLKAEFMYGFEGEKKLSFIAKMESLITSMEQRRSVSINNQAGAQRTMDQLIGRMEQMKSQKAGDDGWSVFATEEAKKKLDEEIAKYNVEWSRAVEALQLGTKQADQYLGAIEALREAIKIRLLFK